MNNTECSREPEAMQIVHSECWPDRCPDDLRSHIAQCAICADAVAVTAAFRDDLEMVLPDVHVPPPGLVWWRAELRARQETMRKISQPMTLVQAFGGACTAGVALALLSRAWPSLKEALALIDPSTFSYPQWTMMIAAAIALLIVAPLAMYLVLSDE
jgi:hypothetical protein